MAEWISNANFHKLMLIVLALDANVTPRAVTGINP